MPRVVPVELTTAAGSAGQPRPLVLKPGSAETDIGAATITSDVGKAPPGRSAGMHNKLKIHDKRELAFDEDGDGMLDEKEVLHLIEMKTQGDRTIAHLTKGLVIMGALLVVFFGITIGSVVHSVNVASEDQAKVSGTSELVAADGTTIALTAVAVEDAPLYIIPVLPDDVIKRMDSITVSVGFETSANDDDDDVAATANVTAFSTGLPPGFNISSMNYTFNIASFAKVNSTCAILSSSVGDVLFLNAGEAVLTFGAASPFSGVFGVCSATASCSRTSVSGIDIAGYARAADAALTSAGIDVPAGGGRQRRQKGEKHLKCQTWRRVKDVIHLLTDRQFSRASFLIN
jgi:hypothetical protein